MLRKKSGQSSPIKSGPNTDKLKKKKKKKPSSSAEDDYDEDTEDSDEVKIDEAEFDDIPDEDENLEDKFEEMAQDELIDDEPEMLKYALAEMKHKMNKHRSKYAVDHSHVPGYDKGSYHTEQNPLLNTKTAQQILRTTPKHKKGLKGHTQDVVSNVATNLADKGVKVGNKRFQFQFGAKDSGIGSDESSPSLFGSILPSFIYDKIRADPDGSDSKYRTKDPNDPFADDPFFDGFRRNLKFPPEDMQKSESNPAEQRTNSKFTKAEEDEAKYMARKSRQLAKAKNPLTKYRVAKQVGQKTKSSRQCRMLFAKCPYEFNEIMTMINNVKKLLNEQAIVGDKEVLLKQPAAGTASIADVLGSTTSLMGGTGVNLQTGQSGATGITHISQQLANGDNVEIMLKIKPKGGPVEKYSSTTAAEIAAANKSLQDMKKAIQAIAKLHNQTEYGGSGTPQFQFIQPSEIIAAAKVVSNAAPSTTLKTTTTKSTSTSTWKPAPVLKFEENTSQLEPAASPSTLAEVAPGFSGESTSSSQETSSEEASSIKQQQTNIRNKIKDLQSQPKPSQNPNQKPKPPTGPGSGSGSASGSKEDDEEGDDDQEEEDEDDEDALDDSPVPSRHPGGGHRNGNGGYNGGHHHGHGHGHSHGHGHGAHNFGPGEGPPPFLDDPNYHGEHDDDDDNTEISFSFRQQPIKKNKNKRPPPPPPKPQNSNSGPVYIDFDISSKSPPPSTTYSTISGAKMRPPSPLPTRPAPYRIIRNKNNNNNGGGR